MAEAVPLDSIEHLQERLRQEVDSAQQQWLDATPVEKPEARRRFLKALHRFSVLVFEGKILPEMPDGPAECLCRPSNPRRPELAINLQFAKRREGPEN